MTNYCIRHPDSIVLPAGNPVLQERMADMPKKVLPACPAYQIAAKLCYAIFLFTVLRPTYLDKYVACLLYYLRKGAIHGRT